METEVNDTSYLMDNIEEKIHRWLVELTYWYGWKRGFTACREKGDKPQPPGMNFFLVGWDMQSCNLEFRWYTSYSHYYLTVKDCRNDSLSDFVMGGKQLDEIVAIHSNDNHKLKAQDGIRLAECLEKLIKNFFPDIHQVNGLRICPSPIHSYNHQAVPGKFHSSPHLSVCKWISRTWICEPCIDKLGLSDEDNYSHLPLKKYQNEMKRLTPERKFSVLQRDQFTCQKCGNSAINTCDIQLRVKHIIQVMDGGKTTLDNLITVCSNCK